MKNELTLDAARALSDDDLKAAFDGALRRAAQDILTACIAVTVLNERGVDLPSLPSVFRYAEDIAHGRLSARAMWKFHETPFLVSAMKRLPLDLQEELAAGRKVKIAIVENGRVRSAERTVMEMSQLQLRLAFEDGKITDWQKQGEWLIKAGHDDAAPSKRWSPPRFDHKRGRVVVPGGSCEIDDLMQPLAAAGYQIVPIYKGNRLPPAGPVAVKGARS